ncbi:putative transposase [Treponema primitia ZAS-2]|uniref:Putative transposase n=1 Tax=Treponema primitia (strain ATCC BAA-887 / DSM 12427 / ZAS-2) TaxID=545694 RepID=F5YQL3_TREPZ|nr:putative transposase [Treponema primitia ZAS-2]
MTAQDLDRLQLQIKKETKLKAKTVNSILAAVCIPIREAFRVGRVSHNPAQKFRGLGRDDDPRGILSSAELKKLFAEPWETEAHRLAVALSHATGMRLGEILAIGLEDITLDFEEKPVLWVRKSWSTVSGHK